jgi:hypothetical protein
MLHRQKLVSFFKEVALAAARQLWNYCKIDFDMFGFGWNYRTGKIIN